MSYDTLIVFMYAVLSFREYAQTLASHVGMLTMSQMGAAERRKEWNKEVAALRSTCQVRISTLWVVFALKMVGC
jgi:hypothetical protein